MAVFDRYRYKLTKYTNLNHFFIRDIDLIQVFLRYLNYKGQEFVENVI